MRKHTKRLIYIKGWGRLVCFLLIVAVSATSGAMLHANAMDRDPAASAEISEEVSLHKESAGMKRLAVSPGDTLWEIAEDYKKENEPVRAYIDELMTVNALQSAELQVGQVLVLP